MSDKVEQIERIAELERKNGWMVMKLNAEHLVRQNVERENAKLRELCASLYEFAMSEYPDGTELNFADRMRELGVEV